MFLLGECMYVCYVVSEKHSSSEVTKQSFVIGLTSSPDLVLNLTLRTKLLSSGYTSMIRAKFHLFRGKF